ncbi:alpha/beta hydrolase [Skermanella mucosa]|uniref:alpha/beta fold hydrolase n=1 Tax=Skermanella mucosa TaxID=1789672 RepID=UPI001E4A71C5|nr:alpha/beta hydrolase [Skermanella mucosa]UEM19447.1 alpha/beta hydrolase [Skermanella mucosa]
MIKNFMHRRFDLGGAVIHAAVGGVGPPLLLLHGYPQTHVTWHRVAPILARRFTVVAPDLRGYGDSAPPLDGDYSKRAMAADQAGLMAELGFDRFGVTGHDRGGRVAYRLALDHPGRVSRLAVLDMVPTLDMWEMMDAGMAMAVYHWLFLAQPDGLPESLIGADPGGYLTRTVRSWCADPDAIDPAALAEYIRCFRRPEVVQAACGDYRAGAGVDRDHDAADRAAGRRIACPVLALWARGGTDGRPYDPLAVWRRWADDVSGREIACGHFLQEEAPDEVARALLGFFA